MAPVGPHLNKLPDPPMESILKNLSLPDIYRLRGVSPRWKSAIDQFKPDLSLRSIEIFVGDFVVCLSVIVSDIREGKMREAMLGIVYTQNEQGFTKNRIAYSGNHLEEFTKDFTYLLSFKRSLPIARFVLSRWVEPDNQTLTINRIVDTITPVRPILQVEELRVDGWQNEDLSRILNLFAPGPLKKMEIKADYSGESLNIRELCLLPHWNCISEMTTELLFINVDEDSVFPFKNSTFMVDQMTIEQFKIFIKVLSATEPESESRTCTIDFITRFGAGEFESEFGNTFENLSLYLWRNRAGGGSTVRVEFTMPGSFHFTMANRDYFTRNEWTEVMIIEDFN